MEIGIDNFATSEISHNDASPNTARTRTSSNRRITVFTPFVIWQSLRRKPDNPVCHDRSAAIFYGVGTCMGHGSD